MMNGVEVGVRYRTFSSRQNTLSQSLTAEESRKRMFALGHFKTPKHTYSMENKKETHLSLSLLAISSYGTLSSALSALHFSPMSTPCSVNFIPG